MLLMERDYVTKKELNTIKAHDEGKWVEKKRLLIQKKLNKKVA